MGLKVFLWHASPANYWQATRRSPATDIPVKRVPSGPNHSARGTATTAAHSSRRRSAGQVMRTRHGTWRAYSHCRTLATSTIHAPRAHTFPYATASRRRRRRFAGQVMHTRRGIWRAYSHCRTLAKSKIHAPRVHTLPRLGHSRYSQQQPPQRWSGHAHKARNLASILPLQDIG